MVQRGGVTAMDDRSAVVCGMNWVEARVIFQVWCLIRHFAHTENDAGKN
jgi:hypothetical protein